MHGKEERSRTVLTSIREFLASISLAAICLLAACTNGLLGPSTTWRQSHATNGNSGFAVAGPAAVDAKTALTLVVGDPGTSTPVEGPDGRIFLSIFEGDSGVSSRIVTVNTARGLQVRCRFPRAVS